MGTVLVITAVIALLIFINGLYVAAEFATVSARRTRISEMAADGNRLAQLLEPIVADTHRIDTYVAACQLGITASSLVLGFYGQSAVATAITPALAELGGLQQVAAQSISATGVLIVLTILQVVMGELVPKSVAIRYPERLALLTMLPMRWSLILMRPAIALFNGTGSLLLRLLRVPNAGHHIHVHSPEEIEMLVVESHEGGLLDAEERQLLRNAFRMGDLTAAKVMVPRNRLVAAPEHTSLHTLLATCSDSGYTRIPLFRENIDHIAGIVHVKDLFRLYTEGRDDVAAVIRDVPFVPESKLAVEVWAMLREKGSYVAIVIDEFGGTAGMITMEDLIEEIFGELQDEFDEETALMVREPHGRVRLRGDILVGEVNEMFELKLPTEGINTIGGLVLSGLSEAPKVGDEVTFNDITFRVEAVSGAAILEVSLQPPSTNKLQLPGEFGDEP